MKIAVLGTGVVGQTISEKLSQLGHQMMMGTRNVDEALAKTNPDNFGRPPLSEWKKSHSEIEIATFDEAAAFGELIINATNGAGTMSALEQAGKKNLAGKVLIDIANPLDFSKGMPPSLFVSNTDSLAETIQRAYPETKVVKSLNTMNAFVMMSPGLIADDHNVFVGSNDDDAKSKVKELLMSIGWKKENIIDLGDLTSARGTEQILPIWVRLWSAIQNPMFNFKIVQGAAPNM